MERKISNIRIAIICCTESEDMEVIIPYDIWKRAGIIAETISFEKKNSIFLQCGIKITCSELIDRVNLDKYNALYLPGGKGFNRLFDVKTNKKICEKVKKFAFNEKSSWKNGDYGKWIFASSEATIFLSELGCLEDKKVTTSPGNEEKIGENYSSENIVVSKNFVTFKSAFFAFDFALLIVEKFLGKQIATNVAHDILYVKK